jgi:hypothetical protein
VQGCNDLLASYVGKDVSAIVIPALPIGRAGSRTISTAASSDSGQELAVVMRCVKDLLVEVADKIVVGRPAGSTEVLQYSAPKIK